MTETAEMQAKPVAWLSRGVFGNVDEHLEICEGPNDYVNLEYWSKPFPVVLQSDFDAMRAQRDEGQHVAEEMSADVSELGAKLAAAEARIAGLREALKHAVEVAEEARKEWDAAPSGMRAGKLLIALGGNCPGYRSDIDAIHAALSQPSSSNSGDTP
jgi:hypothetical protein